MGADANWLVEAKLDGHWEALAQSAAPCMARDYGLFGLVNGIRAREGVEPLVEPRGFPDTEPDDYNLRMSREEAFIAGGTASTWLSPSEAAKIADKYAAMNEGRSIEWDCVVVMLRSLESAGYEARVLFATDQG